MTTDPSTCLVILAGGQSTRMGTDKAVITLRGRRMVDILIDRFAGKADHLFLSASQDYGTGLPLVSDNPDFPGGPVGGIFSLAERLPEVQPGLSGFATVPVDAPRAPADLVERLSASGVCAVAQDGQRIHPTFAYWRCDIINRISATHDLGERAPSLQWLARQSAAQSVTWSDETLFMNINRPEDLAAAEHDKTAGA
ncbi:molybdenum cofactor guanylyltransferase [uncultured Parasphingorhabdus sp.]|uniref:molybdenum cofactor guanylyltransferase n=1 Tax=uncultured Parasphingorhabdus sp. TaxID=2709694 RepID=UPI0030D8E5FC|tara:strand:+ start:24714 stop:25304 length:591 start_codon:yes stop_codon:yes gene_type:complete